MNLLSRATNSGLYSLRTLDMFVHTMYAIHVHVHADSTVTLYLFGALLN